MFGKVPRAPEDSVFGVMNRYKADPSSEKVNVSVGAFRDDFENPVVFKVVHKVEEQILDTSKYNHEYLPIIGDGNFLNLAAGLLLGENSAAIKEKRVAKVQALGGTGALRLGAAFLRDHYGDRPIYISNPTWGNHQQIFQHSGFSKIEKYTYYRPSNRDLDLEGFLGAINNAPDGSIFILHACAHNPTGVDPTKEQWKQIAEAIRRKKIFPFFDCAYQGFATGSLDNDAFAVRYFIEQGFEVVVAQSFSKNMGLYGERVGATLIVTSDAAHIGPIESQLAILVRGMYSNPPTHGARVVGIILGNKELRSEWEAELKAVSGRILKMRQLLFDTLKKLNTPGDWTHIINQIGMFTFVGLTVAQCDALVEKHHIYLLNNSRISLAGLTPSNVEYVARAIHEVVTGTKANL